MDTEILKVSPEQLDILLEEVQNDPTLVTSRGRRRQGDKAEHFEKWVQLAKKLNAVGKSANQGVTKWQQVRTE